MRWTMHFGPKSTDNWDIFHFTIRILKFYMLIHGSVYRWSKVLFWIDLQNHHLSSSHCFLWSSSFCLTSDLAHSWSASSQMIWSLTDFPQPPLVVSILIRGFHYQGSTDVSVLIQIPIVCHYHCPEVVFQAARCQRINCFKQEWWIVSRAADVQHMFQEWLRCTFWQRSGNNRPRLRYVQVCQLVLTHDIFEEY